MASGTVQESALGPYRVLDLTEGGYNWCGRILADFGADVIKVEPPGGSPTRKTGPFWHDVVDPERSLYWWAYCLNKRSVTLDLESSEGQRRFRELAAGADIILESFTPGFLDGVGLGYEALQAVNPGLVLTSMTPFGQTGPYAHYRVTDIVSWSMGGMQYITGDNDRPPVRVSIPQAEIHAGAQGAAGTLIALWHRLRTGEGQQVDISTQEAVIWTTMNAAPYPKILGYNLERAGGAKQQVAGVSRTVYACKDGYLSGVIGGGLAGGNSMITLVKWLDTEGYATEAMKKRDWPRWDMYTALAKPGPEADELIDAQTRVAAFFETKTKAEIYERAIADGIIVAPCNTPKDIWESPQLRARRYWVALEHPGLGPVTYPGPYVKLSESPITLRHPAPSIGQHTEEVLSKARPRPSPETPLKGTRAGEMAFEGLRVLDMSWVGVGPMTMKYLADHGATVVRVESVTRPDPARTVPPFGGNKSGFNRSQFPANFNTSKYDLGLNLAKPEARDLVKRLLKEWKPDVLAESFTPRAMKGWGMDWERVRVYRPDLVYFSTCQQGQTGPHARYAGYGGQAAALAGFYHLTGWPDRGPCGPYGAYTDFVNPPNAAAAVIAALEYRRRTGKGQHIDLSQFECAVHYLSPAVLDFTINGRLQERRGNLDDAFVPHNVYLCKDTPARPGGSWCAIAVTSDEEWQGLCAVAGRPEWATDERFSTAVERKRHETELDPLIAGWTCQHDAHDLMRKLQGAGIAAGAVQAGSDLWDDPQLQHRGFFRWLDHTECGPMPYTGPPVRLTKTPAKTRWAAPLVGQHNELVLKEFLGLSDDEIGNLIAAGALETSF